MILKTLVVCNFQTLFEILNYSVWYAIHVNFIFFSLFWTNVQSKRTTRAEPEDHSLRNAVLENYYALTTNFAMAECACTLPLPSFICTAFWSHHVLITLVEPLWKLQSHSSKSLSHQDFIRVVKVCNQSYNDELVVSFSLHVDKYLGVWVATDTFCARILRNTFVNASSCLLSIQH